MIEDRSAVAMLPTVANLIGHRGDNEGGKILSSEKPLAHSIYSAIQDNPEYNNYDDVPEGSIAIIPLKGTLLKYGTWCSYGTEEIADLMLQAVNCNKISGIQLDIDSGGGEVAAIAPVLNAITEAKKKNKPCIASVDLCASAAYYIACHCDSIIANNNISAEIGSIGVMVQFSDFSEYYKKNGIEIHTIYSDYSKDKNQPYELAKKGKYEKIKEEMLNPVALEFQNAVKKARGEKLDSEVPGILSGKMFYAQEAQEIGLIDTVGDYNTAALLINQELKLKKSKECDAVINEFI